ncbi:MAG: AMMECR1 domain-containing protein [Candidatus Bathyarchaeia archaeon]
MITIEEAIYLIRLARKYLERELNDEEIISSSIGAYAINQLSLNDEISNWKGVYLTIRSFPEQFNKILRIGYPITKLSILDSVKLLSHNASLRLSFKNYTIELSILHNFRQLKEVKPYVYPRLINTDKNGILVVRNFYIGLSFPDDKQDPIDMLSECCLRAGLPPDIWLDSNTDIYTFSITSFKEIEPQGRVCIRQATNV